MKLIFISEKKKNEFDLPIERKKEKRNSNVESIEA